MNPTPAILLSLAVPGAAHIALGQTVRGVIAFVVTVGMFFAGYAILQDRLFQVQLFQPFAFLKVIMDWVPLNLLPEAPNWGCTVIAKNFLHSVPGNEDAANEALRMMRLERPMEHLGFWLTGSSGIVSACFAADAHSLALGQPRTRLNRAFAAGISFLLPGSGHWLAGQRDKAVLMGGAVIVLFALGLFFSAGAGVDRGHHDAYWICQSLFGGGTLISAFLFGPVEVPDPIPLYYSLGYTLAACAGLMNVVVMVDAYTVVDRTGEGA